MLELHPDWLGFVAECDEDKGARMHMTAVDFILQPFPLEKFYVPRGSQHEVVIQVKAKKGDNAPQFIVWKFELEDLDVDFSVSFAPEPYEQPVEIVHARTKYVATTTNRAVEGMYRCLRPGRATLVWDNSYSRLRGKNVMYQVQVVSMSIMESASAAADALDEAVQAEKARDQERDAALSTALIQSWLLSAPINVAGHLAWKLFGSQEETAVVASSTTQLQRSSAADYEARSLLEELNGLNMQLMERMTDDFDGGDKEAANLTSEMDSATHKRLEQELGQAEAQVLRCRAELGYPLSNHLTGTSTRLEKIAREMATTKQNYEEQMQTWEQERLQLTQQLVKARGQRRVLVTELRNMRSQTEGQIAVAMAEAGEARMVNKRLKKQNELLLTQIRTLINEAEDNEKKLQRARGELQQQKQKPLQGETLPMKQTEGGEDDAVDELPDYSPDPEVLGRNGIHGNASTNEDDRVETTAEEDDSPVPYTLSEDDIAILNGHRPPSALAKPLSDPSGADHHEESETLSFSPEQAAVRENPYRARLVAFFEERDLQKIPEVDEMLASYRGVEESLFESLELKYSFMELNQRIAQAL
ncbi:hypothetical protein JM18_007435 [Phytophthora kernoviae]|uniref:GOLD domain-containing protein n=2 Tax=Phytophthora kernoviae TaxID=325452 RepID=A0A8T0M2I1_9STRA|nr:hypothetical protein G195_003319 [Phytophthora kernoviae 00238/432]KAG2519745.1 hypothetical protein JM18_007435 [Phytophthora kernoviae]KAG2526557.1 hypothetical protein JM16_002693 [Phytophthora kernoviae]